MTDLYLILHRVRNQPAFDIAEQMKCPSCENDPGCTECSGLGYWWIASTWGFRCHPYWTIKLDITTVSDNQWLSLDEEGGVALPNLPPDWPDLFPINSPSPHPDSGFVTDLIATLGLGSKPIKRRII